jgi:hypothetical protein
LTISLAASAQSVYKTTAFSLASPFVEPDGRNEYVRIGNDFICLAKTRGNQSGSSDFVLERFSQELISQWQTPLSAESSEEYKKLYFNGTELILLSVIHLEKEKRTKLTATAFNPSTGAISWTKELESYEVEDWEMHPHKGRVKESFYDVICEHVDPDFVTPIEYAHHINFSPDESKFVSYIYNYGEKNLTATVSIYTNSGELLKRGKVAIDNDYTNHGIYVNNAGLTFIINANGSGKLNIIKLDLDTKDFTILDLPGSNFLKDDFRIHFESDDILNVANSEVTPQGKVTGVILSTFDFNNQIVTHEMTTFPDLLVSEIQNIRKNSKVVKGEEDWKDYDICHFMVGKDKSALVTLEKRLLYAEGYPHISREVFDKSHKKQLDGHLSAEGIIVLLFNPDQTLKWAKYVSKNQVFPALDGLNTVSFVIDNLSDDIRLMYATSENMDANLHNLNYFRISRTNGQIVQQTLLPNEDKLTLVRDYTVWYPDGVVVVGKKGLLGKKSSIVRYKF